MFPTTTLTVGCSSPSSSSSSISAALRFGAALAFGLAFCFAFCLACAFDLAVVAIFIAAAGCFAVFAAPSSDGAPFEGAALAGWPRSPGWCIGFSFGDFMGYLHARLVAGADVSKGHTRTPRRCEAANGGRLRTHHSSYFEFQPLKCTRTFLPCCSTTFPLSHFPDWSSALTS